MKTIQHFFIAILKWFTRDVCVILYCLVSNTNNRTAERSCAKTMTVFFLQMHDDYHVICKGLLKKESNIEMFTGLHVKLSTEEHGIIDGTFGLSGKIKIRIPGKRN